MARHPHPQGSRRAGRRLADTLRRWAQDGRDPGGRRHGRLDRRRRRARADRRPAARARPQPRADPRGGRSRAGSPTASSRTCSTPTERGRARSTTSAEQTGLEPALIERFWPSIGLPASGLERPHRGGRRRRSATSPSVLDAGFPLVAFLQLVPRVRAGAVPDRRRRGAALPPLRARAADARGRARARDGRGDGGRSRATCCRSPRRSWTTSTSASSSTSSSRTWSATWRSSSRTRTWTSAACGWRSRSPTSPATRASPRRRARRRRSRRSSASSRP